MLTTKRKLPNILKKPGPEIRKGNLLMFSVSLMWEC